MDDNFYSFLFGFCVILLIPFVTFITATVVKNVTENLNESDITLGYSIQEEIYIREVV